MIRFLVLGFFCLLLLPSVGSGQGIEINEEADEKKAKERSLVDIYMPNIPSKRFTLKDKEIYKKQNVREVAILRQDGVELFNVTFNNDWKIISSKRCAMGAEESVIKVDSIFQDHKTIVVSRYHHYKKLYVIDSMILDRAIIRTKKNNRITCDRLIYKSYKIGYYLAERNNYYKDNAESIFNTFQTLNTHYQKWRSSYYLNKQIDGNFLRMYTLNMPIFRIEKITTKKTFEYEKMYLCQSKLEYKNIIEGKKRAIEKLLQKNHTKYFVEGESLSERGWILIQNGSGFRCGYSQNYENRDLTEKPIIEEMKSVNAKGLIDTIFTCEYYMQPQDEPCVKPIDSNYKMYLWGKSGIPRRKTVKYIFHYEYFDE